MSETKACRADPIGVAMYESVAEAKLAHSALMRLPSQFPCVAQENGRIDLHPDYATALKTGRDLPSVDVAILPKIEDVLKAAEITTRRVYPHKTSHGLVKFVSFPVQSIPPLSPCEAAAVETQSTIDCVLKIMPLVNLKTHDGKLGVHVFNLDNSAYVDPLLAWFGSQMVDKGKSIAFPHLFGTFMARMSFREHEHVPVIGMIMEELDGNLYHRLLEHMKNDHVDWQPLIAEVLQAMLVMSQGQNSMSLVHNDAHLGNFMTKAVKNPEKSEIYIKTNKGRVLRLPVPRRVVIMDFGRASAQVSIRKRRIESSEIKDKFPKWSHNSFQSDVMHFAAVLLQAQPSSGLLEREAARPDAPASAKALLRLMKSALQCRKRDMYDAYVKCHKQVGSRCGHQLIHVLRAASSKCVGAKPEDWLNDDELTSDFVHVGSPAPFASVLSPTPDLRA